MFLSTSDAPNMTVFDSQENDHALTIALGKVISSPHAIIT